MNILTKWQLGLIRSRWRIFMLAIGLRLTGIHPLQYVGAILLGLTFGLILLNPE